MRRKTRRSYITSRWNFWWAVRLEIWWSTCRHIMMRETRFWSLAWISMWLRIRSRMQRLETAVSDVWLHASLTLLPHSDMRHMAAVSVIVTVCLSRRSGTDIRSRFRITGLWTVTRLNCADLSMQKK